MKLKLRNSSEKVEALKRGFGSSQDESSFRYFIGKEVKEMSEKYKIGDSTWWRADKGQQVFVAGKEGTKTVVENFEWFMSLEGYSDDSFPKDLWLPATDIKAELLEIGYQYGLRMVEIADGRR